MKFAVLLSNMHLTGIVSINRRITAFDKSVAWRERVLTILILMLSLIEFRKANKVSVWRCSCGTVPSFSSCCSSCCDKQALSKPTMTYSGSRSPSLPLWKPWADGSRMARRDNELNEEGAYS
ncbi:hypothetical protein [Xaviernesmea oryzae]|uniref:hypothetical protein n=1 Tax=Xaviernesmea oryzae TaxID=464029 RepID=UPI001113813A|nr:hypothetical protein [Xaviernesmea oryzae]